MHKLVTTYHNDNSICCRFCGAFTSHNRYFNEFIPTSNPLRVMLILDKWYPSQKQQKSIFSGSTGGYLVELLKENYIDLQHVYITSAIRCDDHNPTTAKDYAEVHKLLISEIIACKPSVIICFGGQAISILANRTEKIKLLNQSAFVVNGITIGVTYSLGMIHREPSYFKVLKNDIQSIINNGKVEKRDTAYRLNAHHYPHRYFALDVETMGLSSFTKDKKLLTIAVSDVEGFSNVFNVGRDDKPKASYSACDTLQQCLSRNDVFMIGHNIKFDYLWLKSKFYGQLNCNIIDTLIMYIILDENSPDNSLKALAARFTDIPNHYNEGIDTSDLVNCDFDKLVKYNANDADATLRLYNKLLPIIIEQGKEPLLNFMCEALKVIADIEFIGVAIDFNWVENVGQQIKVISDKFVESIKLVYPNFNPDNKKDTSFNPNSSENLARLLYEELKLPVKNLTDKGSPSVSSETLEDLLNLELTKQQQETILAIMDYKKANKVYSTYFENIDKNVYDGRIHTSFRLGKSSAPEGSNGTVTGRLSSSNPNLQNIPRDFKLQGNKFSVRGIFKASEDYTWVDADYSQLELRVAAWYAKEDKMYDIFNKGLDIHTSVLSQMVKRPYDELVDILNNDKHPEYSSLKNTRVVAKSINFGILYGAGADAIQRQAKKAKYKITKEQAQDHINSWLSGYPKIKKWIAKTINQVTKTGVVSSPTGRERHLDAALLPNNPASFAARRQAINFPVQTLASEMCLAALIVLDREIKRCNLPARIVLTVHDSISIEVKTDYFNQHKNSFEVFIKKCMTTGVVNYFLDKFGFNFDAPLDVTITSGERWE